MKLNNGNVAISLSRFIFEEEFKYFNSKGSLTIAFNFLEIAVKIINFNIRCAALNNNLGNYGKANIQGEEVQKLDEISNQILINYLSNSGQFMAIISEETKEAIFPDKAKNADYLIAIDPLDGSSNIDVNIGVGTIFSIYRAINNDKSDLLQKSSNQIISGYILYSSSTMLVYATNNGVQGFTLDPNRGTFFLSHSNIKIPNEARIYSFNEANYLEWDQVFKNYVKQIKNRGFTQRYIGSMVADIHRTLIYGGIFAYPKSKKFPDGKLRILYEIAPMSFLIEKAGGKAITDNKFALDLYPKHIHERSSIYIGSFLNIKELMSYFKISNIN